MHASSNNLSTLWSTKSNDSRDDITWKIIYRARRSCTSPTSYIHIRTQNCRGAGSHNFLYSIRYFVSETHLCKVFRIERREWNKSTPPESRLIFLCHGTSSLMSILCWTMLMFTLFFFSFLSFRVSLIFYTTLFHRRNGSSKNKHIQIVKSKYNDTITFDNEQNKSPLTIEQRGGCKSCSPYVFLE